MTGLILQLSLLGILVPFIYLIQYPTVLHWLEPKSVYLEVSHVCCRMIICQQHLSEEIFSGRPHLEDFLSLVGRPGT